MIRDIDLNKFEPWDIQEECKIGSIPQNDWYFFSHKDKKYPSGKRTNRATVAGFWKATGRDKVIYSNGRRIGLRKTLVFYNGRAPHGERSDWIMHEYRLIVELEETHDIYNINLISNGSTQEEGWVVCHIFIKKNKKKKTLNNPSISPSNMGTNKGQIMFDSCDEVGGLEQIFQQVERTCTEENIKAIDDHCPGGHGQPSIKPLTYTSHQVIGAPDSNSLHQIVSGLTCCFPAPWPHSLLY